MSLEKLSKKVSLTGCILSILNFSIQLLPSVLVLLPGFTGGAAISYGAVALPFYMDPDNDSGLVMTKDQATWFSKC